MILIVVDASILVAGLMADGRARSVLFHTGATLMVPPFVFEEIQRAVPKIAKRAQVPPLVLESLLNAFEDRLAVIPRHFFAAHLEEARHRCEEADAEGDEDYIALALAMDAPIWTYDKDFQRIAGVRLIGTSEVASIRSG